MSKQPGQQIYPGNTVGFEGDASELSAGEWVEFDDGTVVSQSEGEAVGVVSDQIPRDNQEHLPIPIHIGGVVVAEVTASASAGDTEHDRHLLSDEGGAFKQDDETVSDLSLPDGYAAVNLG